MIIYRILFTILISIVINSAYARNVDLSTVPARDSVQLTIYNSEDLTLVRESRTVSFKQGANPLQFSWANTLIDPTSVELAFPGNADRLEVLDTTFPHDKPQMLFWNVQSDEDIEATIEIIYFTSGITWSADYLAIANAEETALAIESFVRVHNNSGEDYENAQVRLVVGTINLVEKIAELARVPVGRLDDLVSKDRQVLLKREVAKTMMAAAPAAEMLMVAKQIQKQGLSEYFIYTIEGTETIPNGWSKRLRSFTADEARFEVQYRYRPREYGERLVRMYLLHNDTDAGMGETPLPDGQIRVLRQNGRGGLSFLASQQLNYVPIGDKIELNLGENPEVIFELIKLKAYRDNIWLKLRGGNVYRRSDDGDVQIDIRSTVAGWDEHEIFTQRIRNYSDRAINVEVRREYPGDVNFVSNLDARRHDFRTVEYDRSIAAGAKVNLLHEVIRHQGYNRKQDRVEIVAGDVRL